MRTEANSAGREVCVRGKGHDSSASGPDRPRPHCLRLSNMKRTQRRFIQDSVVIRVKIKTARTHTQKKQDAPLSSFTFTHFVSSCGLDVTNGASLHLFSFQNNPKCQVTFCDLNEMRKKNSNCRTIHCWRQEAKMVSNI